MPLPRLLGPLAALGVSACAAIPPSGPTLLALPREGKDYATFQREDLYCQSLAAQQTNPAPQAGLSPVAGGAAIGTLGGAAAGALLGAAAGNPGAGAAIGAGTGLVAGSAVGASNVNTTSWGLQERYDTVYAQCITSYGNRIEPRAPRFVSAPVYPGPFYYGAPYPYFGPPAVGLGFGFGFGPRLGYHRPWGYRRW
jgi:hypothetical protein